MCLVTLAYASTPELPLILAFNRDEYFDRPTAPFHQWDEKEQQTTLYAGQDLQGQGTWLGVSTAGRFAFLTNFREVPGNRHSAAPSRGSLPLDFLQCSESPLSYLGKLNAQEHNGFNLVVGDLAHGTVGFLSNRAGQGAVKLPQGVHSISNGPLDCSWPKTELSKAGMKAVLSSLQPPLDQDNVFDAVFEQVLGSSEEVSSVEQLPRTGVALELECKFSPVFILPMVHQGKLYGTRSQTVLLVGRTGEVQVRERTHYPEGPADLTVHKFNMIAGLGTLSPS